MSTQLPYDDAWDWDEQLAFESTDHAHSLPRLDYFVDPPPTLGQSRREISPPLSFQALNHTDDWRDVNLSTQRTFLPPSSQALNHSFHWRDGDIPVRTRGPSPQDQFSTAGYTGPIQDPSDNGQQGGSVFDQNGLPAFQDYSGRTFGGDAPFTQAAAFGWSVTPFVQSHQSYGLDVPLFGASESGSLPIVYGQPLSEEQRTDQGRYVVASRVTNPLTHASERTEGSSGLKKPQKGSRLKGYKMCATCMVYGSRKTQESCEHRTDPHRTTPCKSCRAYRRPCVSSENATVKRMKDVKRDNGENQNWLADWAAEQVRTPMYKDDGTQCMLGALRQCCQSAMIVTTETEKPDLTTGSIITFTIVFTVKLC